MTQPEALEALRKAVQEAVKKEGLRPLAARTGIGLGRIRSVLSGTRVPKVDTVDTLAQALGLEFYVGPPRAAPKTGVRTPELQLRPSDPAVRTVRDPELARLLAAIEGHWEDLGGDYARRDWLAKVWGTSEALGARRSGASPRGSAGG